MIRTIEGWDYKLTLGSTLDVYKKGEQWKAIDRETGREVLNYKERI